VFRCYASKVVVKTKDIVKLTKEKTARVIPNAIQICTRDDKTYFFASLASRDKTFLILDRVRKCAVEDQVRKALVQPVSTTAVNDTC